MKYIQVIKPSLDLLIIEIEKRYVPYGWEIVNVFHADKKYCAVLTGGNKHPDTVLEVTPDFCEIKIL